MSDFEEVVSQLRKWNSSFFSNTSPIYISRAPGRLDLMGGNVDFTGGLVFQSTIREATRCAAQMRQDSKIVLWNPQMRREGWREWLEFDLHDLTDEAAVRKLVNSCPEVRWTAYVLGVFYLLHSRYPQQMQIGTSVYIESEVPLNKGVSSSAAVEVATMKAAAAAHGLDLGGVQLAEMCQWVENVIAESGCGIMDQAASVLGDEGYMLPLLCQPCSPYPLVKLPSGLRCWAIDSGVRHAVTGAEYEAARAAAFIGYQMICEQEGLPITLDESGRVPRFIDPQLNGYLSNISPSLFRSKYEEPLPLVISGAEILAGHKLHPDPFTKIRAEMKYRVRACSRYAVEENHRIEMFVELARRGTTDHCLKAFQLMGDLMFQSHWSYTECGLGCEATDRLVALIRTECQEGNLYGAKITGGGAGGTVAVLGPEDADQAFQRVTQKYAEAEGREPYVFDGSSMGADRFGIRTLKAEI